MLAFKLKGQITRDRQLRVKLPKDVPPGAVEVIVLYEVSPKLSKETRRAGRKTAHPAFGIWADRSDISDTEEFAAHLREQMQKGLK